MFSTSGDVQYIGGYLEYIGGYHEYMGGGGREHHDECGGYHEYMGRCSVHLGDTMSTSGGHHEYIRGIS